MSTIRLFPTALGTALLVLGCGGQSTPGGDRAGALNQSFTIQPAMATVVPGQAFQFTAVSPWGGTATWSLPSPGSGGITGTGLYTAPSTPGQYALVAMWNGDVRYTATARITVLPPPPPALSSSNLVSASGAQQGAGSTRNAAVAGEPLPAVHSQGPGGLDVRHGFNPKTR